MKSLRNVILLIFVISFVNEAFCETTKTYTCSPTIVQLRGTIIAKKFPSSSDSMVDNPQGPLFDAYFLKLLKPISVKGNPKDLYNTYDYEDVKEMQISFENEKDSYDSFKKYLDKKVKVRGFLNEKTRGSEFSDVLMTIRSIKVDK